MSKKNFKVENVAKTNNVDAIIDQIVKRNEPTSEDIRMAIEMYNEKAKKEKAEQIVLQLSRYQEYERFLVEDLRMIREMEKQMKAIIIEFNNNREEFLKSGDLSKICDFSNYVSTKCQQIVKNFDEKFSWQFIFD